MGTKSIGVGSYTILKKQIQELVFYREKESLPSHTTSSVKSHCSFYSRTLPPPSLTYSVYCLRFSLHFEGVFNFPEGEILLLSATLLAELAVWRSSPIYHEYQELDIP